MEKFEMMVYLFFIYQEKHKSPYLMMSSLSL